MNGLGENSIFEICENDNFFAPLHSKNQDIYYRCICLLIDRSKEHDVYFDEDGIRDINRLLENLEASDLTEEDEDGKIVNITGSVIISKFRMCGWLRKKELGSSAKYEIHITPICRKIINLMRDVVHNNQEGKLAQRIILIRNTISSALDKNDNIDEPYKFVLSQVTDTIQNLDDDLFVLKEETSDINKAARNIEVMTDYAAHLSEDPSRKAFFDDYFSLKQKGSIQYALSDIREKMLILKNDDEWIESAARNRAELRNESFTEALNKVKEELENDYSFITFRVPEHTDEIEKRINNYYWLLDSKLNQMRKTGKDLNAIIESIFNVLTSEPKENYEYNVLLNQIQKNMFVSHKYVDSKMFYLRKHKKTDSVPSPLYKKTLEQKIEAEQHLQERRKQFRKPYSIKNTVKLLDRLLTDKNTITADEVEFESFQEAILFEMSYLYSKNQLPEYEITKGNELIHKTAKDGTRFKMTNLIIAKKGK